MHSASAFSLKVPIESNGELFYHHECICPPPSTCDVAREDDPRRSLDPCVLGEEEAEGGKKKKKTFLPSSGVLDNAARLQRLPVKCGSGGMKRFPSTFLLPL